MADTRVRETRENNERLTGPRSGLFGIVAVLLGTAATWGLIYYLHVTRWHDPLNPLSPSGAPPAAQH